MPDAFIIDHIACQIGHPGLWFYLRHVDQYDHVGRKYLYIMSLTQDLRVLPARNIFLHESYMFRSSLVESSINRAKMMQKEALEKGDIVDYSVFIDVPTNAPVYLQAHDVEPQTCCANRIAPFFVTTQHCVPGREPPLFA
jgi:hypothetical protein